MLMKEHDLRCLVAERRCTVIAPRSQPIPMAYGALLRDQHVPLWCPWPIRKDVRQLRQVRPAWLSNPRSQAPRTVGRQDAQQIRNRHVAPVLEHQAGNVGYAAARAEVATDVDRGEVRGDIAE
jgi:hypothetical protein